MKNIIFYFPYKDWTYQKGMMNFKTLSTFFLLFGMSISTFAQNVTIKLHLRGVYESKVTLQSLTGNNIKTVAETSGIRNGSTGTLVVPKGLLPTSFVLRFDYKEKATSTPYPSERQIIVDNQNIELWVHPMFVSNPDSTYFRKDERNNNQYMSFLSENGKKKEKLNLIHNFLIGYDDSESDFYQSGMVEYEKRRQEYNQWISKQISAYRADFVSNFFQFQYVTKINWKGTEADRVQSLIDTYFDEIDFSNPSVVKVPDFKDWMNKYVNIYGAMATSVQLRDSLFTLAGKRAIEKARTGHPLVYGWMVDYFYAGFEGFNIQSGIQMLQPYLGDPRCLTNKRIAIEKRLKGIETLVPGAPAPDFMLKDNAGKLVEFSKYKTDLRYKLVLFWSADCQHCKELVKDLHPWYESQGNKKLDIFAISLDDTETEIPVWESAKQKLPGWKHSRAQGGINSPEANAYFVLSTPVMVLVDSRTNKIVALPENVEQLDKGVK